MPDADYAVAEMYQQGCAAASMRQKKLVVGVFVYFKLQNILCLEERHAVVASLPPSSCTAPYSAWLPIKSCNFLHFADLLNPVSSVQGV